jgi:hypothetical protein
MRPSQPADTKWVVAQTLSHSPGPGSVQLPTRPSSTPVTLDDQLGGSVVLVGGQGG